jgi:II/X family phage/plasmid replication protein
VISVDPDGEIEWQTPKWFKTRGSHEATLGVRIDSRADLHVSGSPAKFFQGHNLFGSDDVQALAGEMLARVFDTVPGIIHVVETARALRTLEIDVLRVDICHSYATGSRERVHQWLRAAAESCTMKHRGRGMMDRETLYVSRGSRYSTFKGYAKGHEIEQKGHQLPEALRTPAMFNYADDVLRLEWQLNARGLRTIDRNVLSSWEIGDPLEIYSQHLARVNLAGNLRMTPTDLENVPRELRKTYELWQSGVDLKSPKVMAKTTFYRHRLALLGYGIDIASLRPQSNVVRLVTVIEARPKGIPDFALGTPLYFEPSRRRFG